MQLTRQADYAIRAILHLSAQDEGIVVQTKEVASQQEIPEKYLPTIMRTLARAGIVRTLRGNQGGVMLARRPDNINLREVIEAIEEPIMISRCLREQGECNRDGICPAYPFLNRIQESLIEHLEETTFADLILETTQGHGPSKGWQYGRASRAREKVPA